MNAAFYQALGFVLANEGGFVDDPDDAGGATNFGITANTLAAWRQRPVTTDNVRSLSRNDAGIIYYSRYWLPLQCDKIECTGVATAVLDAGILFGLGASTLNVQRALAAAAVPELTVDGYMGPATLAALNDTDSPTFLEHFHSSLARHIEAVIVRRPADVKFRAGWQNRIAKYLTLA